VPHDYLTRAVGLATDSGMFGAAARSYGALAKLIMLYGEDLTRSAWYAQQALGAASKAGDRLALQAAVLQLMHVEATRGNAERLAKLERQFAEVATSDTARMPLVIPGRALAATWEGRFGDAHRLLATVLDRMFDDGDRAFFSAVCALSLSVEGQRDRAADLVRSAIELAEHGADGSYYTQKYCAMARSLCGAAEALAGRTTHAAKILQKFVGDIAPAAEALRDAVHAVVRAVKNPVLKDDVVERLQVLESMGYGGVAKLLSSAIRSGISDLDSEDGVLTKAEVAVLQALADGHGPKDIALETGRSVYTVQVHIKNIIKKLGCSGRNEALTIARRRGLVG